MSTEPHSNLPGRSPGRSSGRRSAPARGAADAPVVEVFASYQGEGKYVGEAQVFLRLAGCPMRCRWCDTPGSWATREDGTARIVRAIGERDEVARERRIASPFQAALWIASVEPGEPRTVSITGGEPLIWPEFLLALRPMIEPRRVHLETGGGHPEALARVLEIVDHVSLDLKLPSDMREPVEIDATESRSPTTERAPRTPEEWQLARRRSLDLVREHDACVKVVVCGDRGARDYDGLFEDVARRAPELPVYLAPVTPVGDVIAPDPELLVDVVENARDLDLDVRVMPQMHRAMGIA